MNVTDLLNRDIRCACGRVHRCDIGALVIGENALAALPEKCRDRQHILLVADSNTYPLCGARVKELLGEKAENVCLFETGGLLVPDERSVEKISSALSEKTDLILGIGSGVINDLCKYVSFYHHIPSGIVATAPSMDGYASSGAAMIFGGMKVTVTTHAPDMIFGDVGLLCGAPMEMIRAGYADIIGKYSALCDWKLSALVNGEYLCPFVYHLVLEKTNEIRSLSASIAGREPQAIAKLMECLVLIGACLTLLSTTRPGSGSEHHLSHFYEITGLIEHKPYFLHGIDVGYATVITAGLREEILRLNAPVFHSLSGETRKACYRAIFHGYADEVWKIQEKAGWYQKDLDGIYTARWEEIRAILAECPPAEKIREMLLEVGFRMEAFEEMYGAKKIADSVWFGKDLKDRYSVLWLYDRLFFDERKAAEIE